MNPFLDSFGEEILVKNQIISDFQIFLRNKQNQ